MRCFFFTALLVSSLSWAEPAVLLKDAELYAKPVSDAEAVQSLKSGEKLEVMARKGAWANVKAANGTAGWLRVLNIRTGSGQQGEAGIGTIANLFHSGSSGNTVSTGVKGMSEEKLKNARPDPDEVKRLDKFKATQADARSFARQGRLSEQPVAYLQETDKGGER